MSITRAQIARQLLAEGGMPMKKIKGQDHMLAYITPNEANKLVKLGGQKTMTPEGIPAYPEYDNYGFSSQADFDAGDVSKSNDPNVRGDNVNRTTARELAAINALEAIGYSPKKTFKDKVIDSIKNISNFTPFGIVRRGLGGLFNRLANLRGFNPDGTRRTQAQFEQARQNRINQNRIADIMGRKAPFTAMTLENLEKLGYTGPLDGLIGSTNITRSGTPDDVYPDRVDGINATNAATNFIDFNKTISSEDLGTIQQNIKDATGYNTTLAKNYTKQDIENLGAEKGFFGANDQLEALQDYYEAATKYSQSGLGQTRSPSEIRDYINRAGGVIGLGVPNINMDLVPKDFLETEQDFKQQKSPFELLDI